MHNSLNLMQIRVDQNNLPKVNRFAEHIERNFQANEGENAHDWQNIIQEESHSDHSKNRTKENIN